MPNEIVIVIVVLLLVYVAIVLTLGCVTLVNALRRIDQQLDALDDSGTPPATAVPKLPRLSRRMPEPEPGGTKVYPNDKEVWDQGLERTDV
jgi:hypothetical protein